MLLQGYNKGIRLIAYEPVMNPKEIEWCRVYGVWCRVYGVEEKNTRTQKMRP